MLVVETKKPLPGALNISYSMNMGISVPDLSDYNLMDAEGEVGIRTDGRGIQHDEPVELLQ